MDTEAVKYDPYVDSHTKSTTDVPLVKTEMRTVTYAGAGHKDPVAGEHPEMLVSAQSHSSRTQTVETTTVSRQQPPSPHTQTSPHTPSLQHSPPHSLSPPHPLCILLYLSITPVSSLALKCQQSMKVIFTLYLCNDKFTYLQTLCQPTLQL